jgi:hypothetical protein
LEDYVGNKIYKKLYPTKPTLEDLQFYRLCHSLAWGRDRLSEPLLDEEVMGYLKQVFKEMDKKQTPLQKVKCLDAMSSIIGESYTLLMGKAPEPDIFLDNIIRGLLHANPSRVYSNLQ